MKRKLLLLMIALGISSFFYGQTYLTEGFEGGSLPAGWTNDNVSGTHDWSYQNGGYNLNPASAHTGSYNAIFSESNYNNDATRLVTVAIDLSSATSPQLTFWHAQADWSGDQDTLAVYYRISSSDTWHYLGGWTNSIPSWTLETFPLPNPSATYQIAFYGYESYGFGVVLDDVTVEEAPSCPAPTAQTETNITTSGADLGWTDASGSHWDIYVVSTGDPAPTQTTTPTANDVTANPYTWSGGSASTTYDWYVRSDCGQDNSNTSSWTGPSTFTTACTSASIPWNEGFESMSSYGSGIVPNCMAEDGDWVTANSSQSYNRDAHSGNAYVYTNYSADDYLFTPGFDLTAGTSYDFSFWYVTDGNSGWTTVEAKYGTGQTSGDMTTTIGSPISGPTNTTYVQFTASFTPSTSGTYYLSIHVVATSSPWYITFDDLKLEETPSCPAPTAQTETNITTSGADLGWTDASGSHWDIYVVPTGDPAPTQTTTPTANDITANPYTWSGGSASTTYDWYVRSDCGQDNSNTSSWTGPSTFTTLQAPAPVQSLPFSEDWETGAMGAAWNYDAGSVSTIQVSTASAHGGTYGLEQYGNSSSSYSTPTNLSDAYAKALPGGANENWTTWNKMSVDLTSTSSPWLFFWYSMGYLYNNNYNNFWVQVSTDGSTWTDLFSTQTNGSAIAYEMKQFDLSTYNGTAQLYIRFFHNGKYNTNYLYLDDISVTEVTCPDPSSQTETNITATSADLGWTENGSATSWDIELGASGFTPTGTPTQTGVTNPYTYGSLTANTAYDWYVRSNCGGGDFSNWVGANTFTTSDGKAVNPVPANGATGVAVTATTLDWDDVIGADGYHISVGTTSGGTDIVNNEAISGASNSSYTVSSNWSYSTTYYWTITTDYNSGSTVVGDEWSFMTECNATDLPYFQDFDAVTAPDFPGCMTVENTNGDAYTWETNTTNHSSPNSAKIRWNSSAAMNDWFFTRGLNLTGGVTYEVNFMYKAGSATYSEKLAVDWGNDAVSTAMSGTPIFDNSNITTTIWTTGSGVFTPATTGTYYVGFHGHSDANQFSLYVDDIQVVQYQQTANWNGTTDNDWQNENNWSGGVTPGSLTNVTIPAGKTNYPTLTKTAYCNNLTIQSDASGDGSFIGVNNLNISGTATVQRYLTGTQWHDVSAMVSGATVNSFFFNHAPDVWMNSYNESDNTRTPVTDVTTSMPLGTGFEAWVESGNNATAIFTGTINSGDVTPSLSFTDADPHGYNLLGNPFSSAIQWGTGTWALTNIDDQVWVWDGTWKDYVAGTGLGGLTGGIIPMGQGFFVHANAASPTITIPADAQVHSTQSFYSPGRDVLPYFVLSTHKGDKSDQVWIIFHKGSTEAYENGFDGRKMVATREGAAPQIYTKEGKEIFSMDALPPVDDKGRTIPLYFKANENGEQMIMAEDFSLVPDVEVTLEDLKLGIKQNLNKEPVYIFDAVTYQNPARFLLHLNRSPNGIANQSESNIRVYAFDKNLYVSSSGSAVNAKKEIRVYDIMGRLLLDKTLPPGNLNRIAFNTSKAYVVVKVVSDKQVIATKVFIK